MKIENEKDKNLSTYKSAVTVENNSITSNCDNTLILFFLNFVINLCMEKNQVKKINYYAKEEFY